MKGRALCGSTLDIRTRNSEDSEVKAFLVAQRRQKLEASAWRGSMSFLLFLKQGSSGGCDGLIELESLGGPPAQPS